MAIMMRRPDDLGLLYCTALPAVTPARGHRATAGKLLPRVKYYVSFLRTVSRSAWRRAPCRNLSCSLRASDIALLDSSVALGSRGPRGCLEPGPREGAQVAQGIARSGDHPSTAVQCIARLFFAHQPRLPCARQCRLSRPVCFVNDLEIKGCWENC